MGDHRIRLSDSEVDLIVASLRARAAMRRGKGRTELERLAERLADGGRGNPCWRFSQGAERNGEVFEKGPAPF